MKQRQGIISVLLGAASFGFTPIFVELGFEAELKLGAINLSQMIIASLFLWGITFFKKQSYNNLNKRKILKLMLSGTLVGLSSIFYYGSLQYLPIYLSIILLFQFVWIGVILEWVFDRGRLNFSRICSLVLTFIGVFLASDILSGSIYEFPIKGFVLGFLSALTYAGFIYSSGKVATDIDSLLRSQLMISGSTIVTFIIFLPTIEIKEILDTSASFYGFGVAFCGSILPTLLFTYGVPFISTGLAAILSSIELPVAIIMAQLIFSEAVKPFQWLGIMLIIVSIIMTQTTWSSLLIRK